MAYLQLQCMRSYIYDYKGHIRLFLALSSVFCLFKGRASVLVMKHQAFIQLCIANSDSSSYKPTEGTGTSVDANTTREGLRYKTLSVKIETEQNIYLPSASTGKAG